MKCVAIDASVALKWVLSDEEHIAEASQILLDHHSGRLEIVAPTLLGYEYSNALWVAVRQARLTQPNARTAIRLFNQLDIRYHDLSDFWSEAAELAFQYQRSFYDSAYVALAQQLNVWLFTGDRRLYNALQPHLSFVRWVGEYRYDALPETS